MLTRRISSTGTLYICDLSLEFKRKKKNDEFQCRESGNDEKNAKISKKNPKKVDLIYRPSQQVVIV